MWRTVDSGTPRTTQRMTLFQYKSGKCLVLEATVTDTFALSNIMESAMRAGAAALRAEESKRRKYSQLSSTYLFEPVAYETTGVCGESTSLVFKELGSKLCDASGDTRETAWLRQRISMAIVRGNAACVRASVSRLSGADPWIPP